MKHRDVKESVRDHQTIAKRKRQRESLNYYGSKTKPTFQIGQGLFPKDDLLFEEWLGEYFLDLSTRATKGDKMALETLFELALCSISIFESTCREVSDEVLEVLRPYARTYSSWPGSIHLQRDAIEEQKNSLERIS